MKGKITAIAVILDGRFAFLSMGILDQISQKHRPTRLLVINAATIGKAKRKPF